MLSHLFELSLSGIHFVDHLKFDRSRERGHYYKPLTFEIVLIGEVTFNGSFDHMNIDATRYPSLMSC
ncbi:hypothetical protein CK203_009146 [Vitis vinifera]|uniref:Uncharacterized protein n=1 Tax=Vitis vinifera TaxID=29760 RepID=A0A438K2A7_VITVI|nr:hypothetical protein CK203_074544 [Vitis vinifera]RVX15323.1 hypothetical protein CK203_009146 [Vitis vinifera]